MIACRVFLACTVENKTQVFIEKFFPKPEGEKEEGDAEDEEE